LPGFPLVPHHLLRFRVPQGRDLLLKVRWNSKILPYLYTVEIPTQELGLIRLPEDDNSLPELIIGKAQLLHDAI
jgi:hypothetical protein